MMVIGMKSPMESRDLVWKHSFQKEKQRVSYLNYRNLRTGSERTIEQNFYWGTLIPKYCTYVVNELVQGKEYNEQNKPLDIQEIMASPTHNIIRNW